ncbi:hypothetical protein FGADI_10373 [Fusarium gaditjirri]|uniref:Uncharacterized protein n=1 Tax=Fusarium gaditjirri TaxID=282569 RepID=A0A8H4SX72_9HYPO|nr:hypothetical protein FGADI_10373 [Fusarium gaditjirri]
MLLLKHSLLAAMTIPVAVLGCQNEATGVKEDCNWVLSGCGPCRKYVGNMETHLEMLNDDAGDFKYDEDNDDTYKSLCEVCRRNYGPKQPERITTSSIMAFNLPKETQSITSIRITQTKPRVGWSTLPGPDDGTTFAWFTKTATYTKTETAIMTTTAYTTISLSKSIETSMGLGETTATSMDPRKGTATSMGLSETSTLTPQKKKHSSAGQIAGIVVGVLSFILFTSLVAWKCLQRPHLAEPGEGYGGPMGDAHVPGGSAFDDSDSESNRGEAVNFLASIGGWIRRHQPPFSAPDEPEEQGPEVVEERAPNPGPPPPPIPVQPGQAPADEVHLYIPRNPPTIPGHQVGEPSIQVPTPDPAQDRSASSTYSQDSGYPRQKEPEPVQEQRATEDPVQSGSYGWI